MYTYTPTDRISSPHSPCESGQRSRGRPDTSSVDLARDNFARTATLDAFKHRGVWALFEPEFQDRQPDDPRLLGNGRVVP